MRTHAFFNSCGALFFTLFHRNNKNSQTVKLEARPRSTSPQIRSWYESVWSFFFVLRRLNSHQNLDNNDLLSTCGHFPVPSTLPANCVVSLSGSRPLPTRKPTRPSATVTGWTLNLTGWPACCRFPRMSSLNWTSCLCCALPFPTSESKVSSKVKGGWKMTYGITGAEVFGLWVCGCYKLCLTPINGVKMGRQLLLLGREVTQGCLPLRLYGYDGVDLKMLAGYAKALTYIKWF